MVRSNFRVLRLRWLVCPFCNHTYRHKFHTHCDCIHGWGNSIAHKDDQRTAAYAFSLPGWNGPHDSGRDTPMVWIVGLVKSTIELAPFCATTEGGPHASASYSAPDSRGNRSAHRARSIVSVPADTHHNTFPARQYPRHHDASDNTETVRTARAERNSRQSHRGQRDAGASIRRGRPA